MRGAWVEMPFARTACHALFRRSPCGERGLKSYPCPFCGSTVSRSPCGERGLKFAQILRVALDSRSLPVRGAWVEMSGSSIARVSLKCRSPCGERGLKWERHVRACPRRPSLPVRGAWVEIAGGWRLWLAAGSLPVRGAWIEIPGERDSGKVQRVAPRAGSVD